MPEIGRHERQLFLFVKTKYELVGMGVTDWTFAANPKTSSKQFVHQSNASGGLSGYAPVINVTGELHSADPVMEYIADLGRTLSVGATSSTKAVIVDLWTNEDKTQCKAVEYDVSVSVDNPGSGAAGEGLALAAALAIKGDGRQGTFNLTSKEFAKTL